MFTNIGIATVSILSVTTLSYSYADDYGVDASFPIHYNFIGHEPSVSTTLRTFGPQKIDLYRQYMKGCHEAYDAHVCDHNEKDRLELNLNQPRSMTNYTEVGFKKVRLSDNTWAMLRSIWESVMAAGGPEKLIEEQWPEGNTYTNHWSSPTRMKYIESFHEYIYREAESKVKEWIDAKSFSRSSLYGIRVYTEGSMLATHVDRDPLITSAIINVGQDVEEEWPLEVYDHDGRAHNITMQPGDMMLYESATTLHGRPFPLKGKYYANIFVHFKPHFDGDEEKLSEGEL